VAVLESQLYSEMTFQTATDGVGGQRSQQLPALGLTGWGDLVIGELAGWPGELEVGYHATDDLSGVGQRQSHTVDKGGVVDLALLGTLKQCGGNVERHDFLRCGCAART
jgi:hypothetical protein